MDGDIDGLVHISQISEERVDKIKDHLKVGQEIEARVTPSNPAKTWSASNMPLPPPPRNTAPATGRSNRALHRKISKALPGNRQRLFLATFPTVAQGIFQGCPVGGIICFLHS